MIKACTDEEQSRKLAKILPPESADMHYKVNRYNDKSEVYLMPYSKLGYYKDNDFEYCVPCWSLAALFENLPKEIGSYSKIMGYFDGAYHCDYLDEDSEGIGLCTTANNLIDAVYEMVIKLHEQKLI